MCSTFGPSSVPPYRPCILFRPPPHTSRQAGESIEKHQVKNTGKWTDVDKVKKDIEIKSSWVWKFSAILQSLNFARRLSHFSSSCNTNASKNMMCRVCVAFCWKFLLTSKTIVPGRILGMCWCSELCILDRRLSRLQEGKLTSIWSFVWQVKVGWARGRMLPLIFSQKRLWKSPIVLRHQ